MFTEQEKARIRHFLGYPSWSQMASSIQLGVPSGSHALFVLEQSFSRILPEGENAVRADLCECESIEAQLRSARSRMKAAKLGELQMNQQEALDLRRELTFWQRRLADDLGAVVNPYSSMSYLGMAGGMNAGVQG